MLLFAVDSLKPEEKKKTEVIYVRYGKKMFAAANRILNDKSSAEDALQNSFLSILKFIDKIDVNDNDGLEGYVVTIAKNEAYNILRKRQNDLDLTEYVKDDTFQSAEERIFSRDAYEKAVSIMRDMDEKYRAPLYLNCVMGYSANETAKLLHRNKSTVNSQIFRGKKLLADKLREAGYEY